MREKQRIDTEGLYGLIAAIVRQAIRDYEYALRGRAQFYGDRKYSVEAMEKFFLSDYGQMLCAGSGKWIIEQCRLNLKNGTGLLIDQIKGNSEKREK